MPYMRIKDLAAAVDMPTETIRYYERTGLLPPAKRTENNYRIYDESDENRLRFIRNCRTLDMSLDEIRELIVFIECDGKKAEQANDCSGVKVIISEHLQHVQDRIDSLMVLKKQLDKLLDACTHTEPTASCGMVRKLFADMGELKLGDAHGVHTTKPT